jgi:hypothetical protein
MLLFGGSVGDSRVTVISVRKFQIRLISEERV